jgi:hypothetical protein
MVWTGFLWLVVFPGGSPSANRLPPTQVRSGQVRLQLTVSQSVCLGVEPHLGLMTRYLFIYFFLWKLQSCQFWGALSDERSGLSFVSQSLEVGHLSVYTYNQNIYNLSNTWYAIFTKPLSVQAQYSRLCPISSSFCYNGSLVTWTVVCRSQVKVVKVIFQLTCQSVGLSYWPSVVKWLSLFFTTDGRMLDHRQV